jgi:hypothetical protein
MIVNIKKCWFWDQIRIAIGYISKEFYFLTNMTSGATGGSNMTNATAGGNQSAANPLAKVPIIGKLLGGK